MGRIPRKKADLDALKPQKTEPFPQGDRKNFCYRFGDPKPKKTMGGILALRPKRNASVSGGGASLNQFRTGGNTRGKRRSILHEHQADYGL